MKTSIGDRGPGARAERARSVYDGGDLDGEEGLEWDRSASGGLARVLIVVVLLHVAGIGGVLSYRWLHREGREPGPGTPASSQAVRPPVEELVPEPRTNGRAIVVDHPTLEGHVRYRVGTDEQLIEVARRFNASVAEIEKLNSLQRDLPLYSGQWLTVPDHRNRQADETLQEPEPLVPASAPKPEPALEGPREPVKPAPVFPKTEAAAAVPPRAAAGLAMTHGTAAITYKVNPGDTPYRIALRYGISWQELLEYNGLTNPKQLQAGQVLKIPPKR